MEAFPNQIRKGKTPEVELCTFTLSEVYSEYAKGHEHCSSKKTVCVKLNKDKTKFAEFLSAAV